MSIVNNLVKSRNKLDVIYQPISKELTHVEEELNNVVKDFCFDSTLEILGHFFKIPGKRLRPALLLLSARAANSQASSDTDCQLVQLAAAMELIHAASLIHDDIIDGDEMRRGQKTLNRTFGNKIAVLAGDTLYTRAFSTISSIFPREYMQLITRMTENMCMAEIEQAKGESYFSTRESYYKLIRNKTAIFMSICCRLGASLVTSKENIITASEEFGLNFGMTYQIIDDYTDKDPIAAKYAGLKEAKEFAYLAESSIMGLDDSVYRANLLNLIDYIISLSHV